MRVLLTFTGFHDPFSMGLVGQTEQAGPILSLLVTREQPMVSEVDLASIHFPHVRVRTVQLTTTEPAALDLDAAIRQSGILGDHPKLKRALEIAASLAPTSAPVLILGETGTGKELFAQFIHCLSSRPRGQLTAIWYGGTAGRS